MQVELSYDDIYYLCEILASVSVNDVSASDYECIRDLYLRLRSEIEID